MPEFFDAPSQGPDPTVFLPLVQQQGRRRHRRHVAVSVTTVVAVLAAAGVTAGFAVTGGPGHDRSEQMATTPTPPSTPTPTPSFHRIAPVGHVDVTPTVHVNGYTAGLTVVVAGRVPDLYAAPNGPAIPSQSMELNSTRVDWGDSTVGTGSDGGQVECHAKAPLVDLPTQRLSYSHIYARAGNYTITVSVATCAPGSTTTRTSARRTALTVPARSAVDTNVSAYGDCRHPTVEPAEIIETCADTGVGIKNIRWSTWTSRRATGTGTLWYNDCRPDCATGHIHYIPNAAVTLTQPVPGASGRLVFSRILTNPEPPGYATGPYHGGPQPMPTQPD